MDTIKLDTYLNVSNALDRLLKEYDKYGSLIIALDFDDTIFNFHNNKDNSYDMVISLVKDLKSIGCSIIIWTGNKDIELIKNYCKEIGIEFDKINENMPVAEEYFKSNNYDLIPRKIYANAYLDDRAGLLECFNLLSAVIRYAKSKQVFKNNIVNEEQPDEEFSHLKKEDFYEFNKVGTRARSDKTCTCCGNIIPKGQPHLVAKFYPEFMSYPIHEDCKDDFMSKLK